MKFIHIVLGLFIIASIFLGLFLNNYMKESPAIKLPPAYSPNPNAHLQVKGSIPYWDQENAFNSVLKNPQAFNYLNLFWYFLTNEGDIKKYQYATENTKIIDFAHS